MKLIAPMRVSPFISSVALAVSVMTTSAQTHPRLLFGPEDVPALREKITKRPWKEMFETLAADAETGQYRDYNPADADTDATTTSPYGQAVNAYRCAFIYQMTGDDAWAQKARQYVEKRIFDESDGSGGKRGFGWAQPKIKGLGLYFIGKAVAKAYDWCYGAPSWQAPVSATDPKPFQKLVSEKLLEQADVIATNGGTEQNSNAASNWQGNRGSSALLCYLATDEPYDSERFEDMYKKVEAYLVQNVGPGKDSRGWNIEGVGYLGFPMGHVAPAAIAARRKDPSRDLLSSAPGIGYMLWSQYAATTRFLRPEHTNLPVWLLHPDFGDDNASADDANGVYGLTFAFSRPELVPGLKHWYRRLLVPEKNFDYTRAGTIYSILYYPGDVEEADPLSIPAWRDGFLDTGGNGFFTFRNQYKDESDMVAQIYLKLRGNRGHNGPDALSFRILGLNTAWAAGGGRYGPKDNGVELYHRQMNTLYPSDPNGPLQTNGNSGRVVGEPLIQPDGSGHVISEISANNLGVAKQKRWFVADYSRKAGVEAVYVIGDTSENGFFWQLNTLDEPGVTITHDERSFTITGRDGATMKGTVLEPAGPLQWTTGKRQRGSAFKLRTANRPNFGEENQYVFFRGAGDYVVVLTVAKADQKHPEIRKSGARVVNSTITVGPQNYTLQPEDASYGGAKASSGSSSSSASSHSADQTVPSTPTGLKAATHARYAQVDLTWDAIRENADGYIIERAEAEGPWTPIAKKTQAAAVLFSDVNLEPGATYRYRIIAFNDAGYSTPGEPVNVTAVETKDSPYIGEDSFETCAPGPLDGQSSGGGWSAKWTAQTDKDKLTEVIDVSDKPLEAAGVSGGNRAVKLPWGETVATRPLSRPPQVSDETPFYMSYLIRYEGPEISGQNDAWLFNTSWNFNWRFFGVSSGSDGGDFRVSSKFNDGASGGPKLEPGRTYLLAAKIGASFMTLWIDPKAETDHPAISFDKGWENSTNHSMIPGVGLSSKRQPGSHFVIDRIMAGFTFDSVR